MPDEHTPTPSGLPPEDAFEAWNRRYQQLQQDVITAAVAWHAVHRPRLFPDPTAVDEQLRQQHRDDADRRLAETVAVLLAVDDPPQD